MKLTAKLAYSQIIKNRSRSIWTLAGIALSTAMITAVFGFAASGNAILNEFIGENDYYANLYKTTLFGMSAVFVSIIIAASVIVMSNAFRVSAGERTMQFGILKSAGATKRQIAKSILHEGIYLCAVGIPVGIVLGLFVNLAGIQIANFFLIDLNALSEGGGNTLVLHFVLAWQALALSVVVAFATVLLSAWLPARKAAKIPAIDAIRGAGEVKIKRRSRKAKRIRSNWLVGKLFGFEGTLASKSLKRSRRNFRATVVSLTVSIVMLIVTGYFGRQMIVAASTFYSGVDANVVGLFFAYRISYGDDGVATAEDYEAIDSGLANAITEKLREYPDTTVFGVGMDGYSYMVDVPIETLTPKMRDYLQGDEHVRISIAFIAVDAENYAMLCRRTGVPLGSNILVNQIELWNKAGGRDIFAPLVFSNQSMQIVDLNGAAQPSLPLHGELAVGDIPAEVVLSSNGMVNVIVPQTDALNYRWLAKTADADGFEEYMEKVLGDMLVLDGGIGGLTVINIDDNVRATRGIYNLIMVFIYGFVGMLTLVGLTNVISTISTNVRSRSREFAILQSAGMTQGGLGRMLNLESILCSMKSLIIGVPLGVLGSYLIYVVSALPVEIGYKLPWLPIGLCTLGVFVITWAVMRHAASRLRGGNIVETIRGIG